MSESQKLWSIAASCIGLDDGEEYNFLTHVRAEDAGAAWIRFSSSYEDVSWVSIYVSCASEGKHNEK